MFSSHVYVRVGAYLFYSTVLWWIIQYEGGLSGREFIFTKYPDTAEKLIHRGERMFYRTLWVHEKKQDNLIAYQG